MFLDAIKYTLLSTSFYLYLVSPFRGEMKGLILDIICNLHEGLISGLEQCLTGKRTVADERKCWKSLQLSPVLEKFYLGGQFQRCNTSV